MSTPISPSNVREYIEEGYIGKKFGLDDPKKLGKYLLNSNHTTLVDKLKLLINRIKYVCLHGHVITDARVKEEIKSFKELASRQYIALTQKERQGLADKVILGRIPDFFGRFLDIFEETDLKKFAQLVLNREEWEIFCKTSSEHPVRFNRNTPAPPPPPQLPKNAFPALRVPVIPRSELRPFTPPSEEVITSKKVQESLINSNPVMDKMQRQQQSVEENTPEKTEEEKRILDEQAAADGDCCSPDDWDKVYDEVDENYDPGLSIEDGEKVIKRNKEEDEQQQFQNKEPLPGEPGSPRTHEERNEGSESKSDTLVNQDNQANSQNEPPQKGLFTPGSVKALVGRFGGKAHSSQIEAAIFTPRTPRVVGRLNQSLPIGGGTRTDIDIDLINITDLNNTIDSIHKK